MFATSGSAANSSTLNPGGTLKPRIAAWASSLAGITLRGPDGPAAASSWAHDRAVATNAMTKQMKDVRIGRHPSRNAGAQERGRPPNGRPRHFILAIA